MNRRIRFRVVLAVLLSATACGRPNRASSAASAPAGARTWLGGRLRAQRMATVAAEPGM